MDEYQWRKRTDEEVKGISNSINTRFVLSLSISYLDLGLFIDINYFLLILSFLFCYITFFNLIRLFYLLLAFCLSCSIVSVLFFHLAHPLPQPYVHLSLSYSVDFLLPLSIYSLSQHFSSSCLCFLMLPQKPVSHDDISPVQVLKFQRFCLRW